MAQENITVTLSGDRTAVIRSFVKNKDRRKIQRAMLSGKEYTSEELEAMDNGKGEIKMTISREALVGVTEVQIECLLIEYNGNRHDPFEELMDSDSEEDYDLIEKAVVGVFGKAGNQAAAEKI